MRGDAPLAMLCVARCLAVVSALASKRKCIRSVIEQDTEKACSCRISRTLAGCHASHQVREQLRSGDQLVTVSLHLAAYVSCGVALRLFFSRSRVATHLWLATELKRCNSASVHARRSGWPCRGNSSNFLYQHVTAANIGGAWRASFARFCS